MARMVVLGVDGGTESVRCMAFDTATGEAMASAAKPYATHFPKPAWAEQDPAEWWANLGEAVRECVANLNGNEEEHRVVAMAVDTTCCSVVALDSNGDALRPCLLWMDQRSGQGSDSCTDRVLATGDEALRVNSGGEGPVSAEWLVPKCLWLKENEPDVYSQADYIGEYQDFINLKLTGRWVASSNNAAVRWHWKRGTEPPRSLLAALGMEDLIAKLPQDALAPGAVVGGLTDDAAAHLGLPAGVVVAQGGADAFIGMIGLNVLRPGELALITGSSHLHLGVTERQDTGRGVFGTYADALLPGVNVVEGGQTSTGSVAAWFKRMCNLDGYDTLNDEASAVPPGCEGLVCQEAFQGNRTPHTDAQARGAFVGLTLKHTRGHMFRAILEGVAFGTRLIIETMRDSAGYSPTTITVAGGVTNSPLWMQITADVLGVPLQVTRLPDAPCLGCAVLAATAAGHYPTVADAARAMVVVDRKVVPNAEAHAEYQRFYDAYRAIYPAAKAIVGEMVR